MSRVSCRAGSGGHPWWLPDWERLSPGLALGLGASQGLLSRREASSAHGILCGEEGQALSVIGGDGPSCGDAVRERERGQADSTRSFVTGLCPDSREADLQGEWDSRWGHIPDTPTLSGTFCLT